MSTRTSISELKETSTEGTHEVHPTSKPNKDTKNWDLIIRNGLAGGAAGCTVSLTLPRLQAAHC